MEPSPFLFGLYKLAKCAVHPLTWMFVLLALVAILAALPGSPRRSWWLRYLSASTLLLLFVFGNPLIARTLLGLLEGQYPPFSGSTTRRFDAIVVLSGGAVGKGTLRPSDQLSGLSLERTICGADLFAQGLAPRLLLAGGEATVFGPGPIEAVEMKRLALRLGVPEDAIVVEDRSRTTYENAVGVKRILGHASILLVTSASHVPRAVGLFRKQGLETTASPCGYLAKDRPWSGLGINPFDLLPDVDALSRNTIAITEVVGTIVYWAIGKL
ncbi:MAG: YdcF family protein [Nitrospirae bacterium]|nr:MAG: YdcF family protein [Nitrospirota bacterium]